MAENEMKTINDVPIILRREIEALMVAPFIRAFSEEFGEERTLEIVSRVVADLAEQAGKDMAERFGDNSLDAYVNRAMPAFAAGGALRYEVKELTPELLRMDTVHCAYVDMYKRIGLEDLGAVLSCGRDEFFVKGFDPEVEFVRNHTLMGGAECCDFCLRKEKKDE